MASPRGYLAATPRRCTEKSLANLQQILDLTSKFLLLVFQLQSHGIG